MERMARVVIFRTPSTSIGAVSRSGSRDVSSCHMRDTAERSSTTPGRRESGSVSYALT